MKIAVSSQNQTQVTGHLGRCQRFWIYDVEDNTIQEKEPLQITKDQSFHESSPKDPHPLDTVQVLISGGMGQGLARRLESKGIQPLITLRPISMRQSWPTCPGSSPPSPLRNITSENMALTLIIITATVTPILHNVSLFPSPLFLCLSHLP